MGRVASSKRWLAGKVAAAAEAGHELELIRCLPDGTSPDGYAFNRIKARCKGCGWEGRVKRSKDAAIMSAMLHLGDVDEQVAKPDGVSLPHPVGPNP